MTKQTGKFLATKTLRGGFGGLKAMKNSIGPIETPPALERSFKVATKHKHELPTGIEMEIKPLVELSSSAEDIHVKTPETLEADLEYR